MVAKGAPLMVIRASPFLPTACSLFCPRCLCLQIKTVLEWVGKLVNRRGGNKVLSTDIGIVTPYIKQVQRIRMLVNSKYPGIKVRASQGR